MTQYRRLLWHMRWNKTGTRNSTQNVLVGGAILVFTMAYDKVIAVLLCDGKQSHLMVHTAMVHVKELWSF